MKELNGYRVGERLAVGGDATIYEALQIETDTRCVLKVVEERPGECTATLDRRVNRLRIEERALRRLSHPHIVKLLECRREGESPILVLERLEPVGDGVKLGPFLRQTALALDYAHERGVVHNDFSRENVLVRTGDIAALIDFGSAVIDGEGDAEVGKSKLLSPERITANFNQLDGRSDQFSLAVTAFLWITGKYPFSGEGRTVLDRILREAPLTLSEAGCPNGAELQPAFDRALQKNPIDRFSTCTEFANALSNPNAR